MKKGKKKKKSKLFSLALRPKWLVLRISKGAHTNFTNELILKVCPYNKIACKFLGQCYPLLLALLSLSLLANFFSLANANGRPYCSGLEGSFAVVEKEIYSELGRCQALEKRRGSSRVSGEVGF